MAHSTQTFRPGDGTPVGTALDLLNTLIARPLAPNQVTRVWFGPAPFPAEVELSDEDDIALDDDDLVTVGGDRGIVAPSLARAIAAAMDERGAAEPELVKEDE